jgi:hypothetical protein
MTPKRNFVVDPMAEGHPEAFFEPRTIPGGWDVSAFFEPEQRYEYQSDMYGHSSVKAASPYDYSQNTI